MFFFLICPNREPNENEKPFFLLFDTCRNKFVLLVKMTKRKADESESDYLRRKLRRLEKKLKKLPSEPAPLLPPPPAFQSESSLPPPLLLPPPQAESPLPPPLPPPPVFRESSPKRTPVIVEEAPKSNAEDLTIGRNYEIILATRSITFNSL